MHQTLQKFQETDLTGFQTYNDAIRGNDICKFIPDGNYQNYSKKFMKMKHCDDLNIQSLFQNHMETEQFPHTFRGDDNIAAESMQQAFQKYVPPPHLKIPENYEYVDLNKNTRQFQSPYSLYYGQHDQVLQGIRFGPLHKDRFQRGDIMMGETSKPPGPKPHPASLIEPKKKSSVSAEDAIKCHFLKLYGLTTGNEDDGCDDEDDCVQKKLKHQILGHFEPTLYQMKDDLLQHELSNACNIPFDKNMQAMLFNQEEEIEERWKPKQQKKFCYEDIIHQQEPVYKKKLKMWSTYRKQIEETPHPVTQRTYEVYKQGRSTGIMKEYMKSNTIQFSRQLRKQKEELLKKCNIHHVFC